MAELDSRATGSPGMDTSPPVTQPPATPAAAPTGQQPNDPTLAGSATATAVPGPDGGLGPLTRYFLKLGTLGFGGPAALVGFMHRDLVVQRRWISENEYRLGVALSQIMPGPLAAQLAIALGYFQHGVLGAKVVGLAFVLPSFFMVVALSVGHV